MFLKRSCRDATVCSPSSAVKSLVQYNREMENLRPDRRRQTGRRGSSGAQTGPPRGITQTPKIPLCSQHFPGTFANSTRGSSVSSRDEESPQLKSPGMFPIRYVPMEDSHLFILKVEKKIHPLLVFLPNKMSCFPGAAFGQHVTMDGPKANGFGGREGFGPKLFVFN